MESWNRRVFAESGLDIAFVQDNHSRSSRGVLRGIHYQSPNPQGKLVRAVRGAVWDVAVDLRRSSDTFLEWVGVLLDDETHKQLWIPAGFGHGFVVLSDIADVAYKATSFFEPTADRAVRYDDSAMAIDWPGSDFVISEKDATAPSIRDAPLFE